MTLAFLLIAGLALLIAGAELLVRGASRLGLRFGLSPLVIGLTIVAFGTSAPELFVSVSAGLAGQQEMAVGNIIGSNIFNVLAVLGISALIAPLLVQQQLIRFDVPLAIGVSLLFMIMALDGKIGLFDGLLLTSGVVAYTIFAIRQSPKESPEVQASYASELTPPNDYFNRLALQLLAIVIGLILLVIGADFLVESAVSIARLLGVSEVIIALTIVAAGTSLPELATSIVAALRGERDIAVGNVIGSGLFNLLAIGGISALLTPGGLSVAPAVLNFDLPVMLAVAIACLPICATGGQIARWEGALFLAYYLAYVAYLILSATAHNALPMFSNVMFAFVLPLTAVTLLVLWTRHRLNSGQVPS